MKSENASQMTRVSQAQLTPLMLECLDMGQEVRLTVTGYSMSPFLRHERDQVVLVKPSDPTVLRTGDAYKVGRQNVVYAADLGKIPVNVIQYFLKRFGNIRLRGGIR